VIGKLFRRRTAQPSPAANLPEGQRVYAVGDIHGCLDLLDDLLAQIARDDAERGPAETLLIFLGDLVDRGPKSAQVVERLIEVAADRAPGTTRFLLGNHEEVFLQAIQGDEEALRFFTRIGGRETILSYGISEAEYAALDYPALLSRVQEIVSDRHMAFLSDFEDMILIGDYAFVHAGVRPGNPIHRQQPKDLRWIRNDFLNAQGPFEKIIVHGHTISNEVEILLHRIGLDTGAYASGKLSAMGFEGGERWVLTATAHQAP